MHNKPASGIPAVTGVRDPTTTFQYINIFQDFSSHIVYNGNKKGLLCLSLPGTILLVK